MSDSIAVLDSWSKPGFYWFVMPPKPGKQGPYILYLSNGKAFESEETDPPKAHAECRSKAAEYLKTLSPQSTALERVAEEGILPPNTLAQDRQGT